MADDAEFHNRMIIVWNPFDTNLDRWAKPVNIFIRQISTLNQFAGEEKKICSLSQFEMQYIEPSAVVYELRAQSLYIGFHWGRPNRDRRIQLSHLTHYLVIHERTRQIYAH